jgi:hypothetical protein
MPTLDWLNREQALAIADAVPYLATHGAPDSIARPALRSGRYAACTDRVLLLIDGVLR